MAPVPPQIAQIIVELTPEQAARVASGELVMQGMLKHATNNQVAAHLPKAFESLNSLETVGQPRKAFSKAGQAAYAHTEKLAKLIGRNRGKTAVIAGAVSIALAGGAYLIKRGDQSSPKSLPQGDRSAKTKASAKLDSALRGWFLQAQKGALTAQAIRELEDATRQYREAYGELPEDQEGFFRTIADHTVKLIEVNGGELEPPKEDAKTIDIAPYLEAQRKLLETGTPRTA